MPITNLDHEKALLIESNSRMIISYQKTIESLGFQVSIATNNRSATDFLARYAYRLVIIHEKLPEINALLLMKIIQYSHQASRNKQAVICLSCSKEILTDDLKSIFLAHGFRHFIDSPIDTDNLKNILKDASQY